MNAKITKLIHNYCQQLQPSQKLLIYGAYGYTAELILGIINKHQDLVPHVVMAGRSHTKLSQVVSKFTWEEKFTPVLRSFAVESSKAIDPHLHDVQVVLNCAGPFSQTARPMIEACVRCGVSYLDITGEWRVFELVHDKTSEETREIQSSAERKGICIIPGVGYDVVPSDCAAKHTVDLYNQKFAPTNEQDKPDILEMGMTMGDSQASQGTTKSMLEGLTTGIVTRKNGSIQSVPFTVKNFRFESFNTGSDTPCALVPWGDISTAYYSTAGVPNINIYFSIKKAPHSALIFLYNLNLVRWLIWFLFQLPLIMHLLKRLVEWGVPREPSSSSTEGGHEIVCCVSNRGRDKSVTTRLFCSKGYKLTSEAALVCALRVLLNDVKSRGCTTPSLAFGSEFIEQFDDCRFAA